MIKSITIPQQEDSFTSELYKFENGNFHIDFSEHINIILGKNGSGKTTLTNIIATSCGIDKSSSFASFKNPMTLMGCKSINDWIYGTLKRQQLPISQLEYDKKIAHYIDKKFLSDDANMHRLTNPYNMSNYSIKSLGESILGKFSNESEGEITISNLAKLETIVDEFPEIHPDLKSANPVWIDALTLYENFINDKPDWFDPSNKPTLILDELDLNLDLDAQYIYFQHLEELSKKWQIIVISHSVFAFMQRGDKYNIISIDEDYTNRIKNHFMK